MKIIKRNGAVATFDISKIIMAVTKANAAVEEGARMTPRQIQRIAESVELACQELGRSAAVVDFDTEQPVTTPRFWIVTTPSC